MTSHDPAAFAPAAPDLSTPVTAAVVLGAGEQVLWTGQPGRVPWWVTNARL